MASMCQWLEVHVEEVEGVLEVLHVFDDVDVPHVVAQWRKVEFEYDTLPRSREVILLGTIRNATRLDELMALLALDVIDISGRHDARRPTTEHLFIGRSTAHVHDGVFFGDFDFFDVHHRGRLPLKGRVNVRLSGEQRAYEQKAKA